MTGRGDEGGRSLSGGHLPGPVGTDEYIAAWSVLVERPLSFDEFSDLPMPPGCTPVELWRHFAALRRVAGVTMGVKPWFRVDRDVSWAFVPKSTQLALNQIMSMSYPDSALNAFVRQGGRADYGLLPFVVGLFARAARRAHRAQQDRPAGDLDGRARAGDSRRTNRRQPERVVRRRGACSSSRSNGPSCPTFPSRACRAIGRTTMPDAS